MKTPVENTELGLRLEEDRRVQMQIKGIISCIVTYSKALNL